MAWVKVASVTDLNDGEMLPVEVEGNELAVCQAGEDYFVISNICTHALAYLSDGFLDEFLIECPLHAGCFDIRTGAGQGLPITEDLKTYPVQVSDGDILVEIGN
ncbi:MAG: non-heme iron oxygenase ferredoxin subunit [Acetobacterales bacterium]